MEFIKTYKKTLSLDLIEELITWADLPDTDMTMPMASSEGSDQFRQGTLGRNDNQKFLKFSNLDLMRKVHNQLAKYFAEYRHQFPGLRGGMSHEVKLQKTPISGGFHPWHTEQGPYESSTRCLAWMVYLNDVKVGGETEFLYQGFKQKAEKGTLVIWPASFTHTHRGNPPYSNEKYIVTGWVNFPSNRYEDEPAQK